MVQGKSGTSSMEPSLHRCHGEGTCHSFSIALFIRVTRPRLRGAEGRIHSEQMEGNCWQAWRFRWRQSSSSSLWAYLCSSPSSCPLCQQLLITPHWRCRACLGLLWLPPPPRVLLHLPNLSSSGDRNEMPTTIGAATVWRRGCRLPQGAKTPWNRRSGSVTPLP